MASPLVASRVYNFEDWQRYPVQDYPSCLRPTVSRLRQFHESKLTNLGECLGEGGFAKVYKGEYVTKLGDRIVCALKIFEDEDFCERERDMLWKSAGSIHIVALHGCFFVKGKDVGIAIELMASPNVRTILTEKVIPQEEVIQLVRQLLEFLIDIQLPSPNRDAPLLHGDLSSDNLYWAGGNLTVCDCGLMAEIGNYTVPILQKASERAPEIYLNQKSTDTTDAQEPVLYNEAIDMWSVGILVFLLTTRKDFLPFYDKKFLYGFQEMKLFVDRMGPPRKSYLESMSMKDRYFDRADTLYSHVSKFPGTESLEEVYKDNPVLLDFLKKTLCWDSKSRLTPPLALAHPYLNPKKTVVSSSEKIVPIDDKVIA